MLCGCSGTGLVVLPGGIAQNADPNAQPLARPKFAAWVSAGAKRCGFAREPATLKASYLSFEAKQGVAREQLVGLERAYDLMWESTYDHIGKDAKFCSNKRVAEIKLALQRQDASDYNPNFSKPEIDSCGVAGCAPKRADPFEAKSFWEEMAKEPAPAP
jgi:hypothetical protein